MEQSGKHKYTNQLINESSPYLLQHAHNPVNWYPWGEEALEKAKKENKLLIISIGYAACHWCHVMEHESFEDTTVARIMNEYFVPIKVDREERPDVDDIYMTACNLITGRGGWPLNAFALPDGRPVWAGTYFPKDQWLDILNQFKKLKEENYERLEDSANRITEGLKNADDIALVEGNVEFTNEDLKTIADNVIRHVDFKDGGRTGAPKFPMPNNYEFLLKYYDLTADEQALEATKITLDKMAYGGIYDQLGGGFARYSVDAYWVVPHFEKMLYDNGQLVSLYSKAFQLTKDPYYEQIVRETLAFVERELMDEEGGFYSSLDADSEGEEGKFYVWTSDEIDSLLTDELDREIFRDYFEIKNSGNWEEHKNILYRRKSTEEIAQKFNLSEEEVNQSINRSRSILMEVRDTRVRPGLDDKMLTSWNALMLNGYIDAYKSLGDEAYLATALKNAQFLADHQMKSDYRLDRNRKDGKSSINGFLDDYAITIDAFLNLYEVTFDEDWLEKSDALCQYVIQHFSKENNGMFNYTSDLDPPLVARKSEIADNVIPSSNSIMARNLQKIGLYLYNEDYLNRSIQMLQNLKQTLVTASMTSFYSNWGQLFAGWSNPPFEIAIVGENAPKLSHELMRNYLPNAIFLGGGEDTSLKLLANKYQEGETLIYVCQNKVCKFPVSTVDEALAQMN